MPYFRIKDVVGALLLAALVLGCGCSSLSNRGRPNPTLAVAGEVIDFQPIIIEAAIDATEGRVRTAAAGQRGSSASAELLAAIAEGSLGQKAALQVKSLENRQDGYQISVQLESGGVITIEQAAGIYAPSIGDPVLVEGGRIRYHPAYR